MFPLTEPPHGDRLGRRVRGPLGKVLAFVLAFGVGSQARAQAPIRESLNDLVLIWIQGNYASPPVCRIGDRVHRGLRRILLEPGSGSARPATGVVRFVELEIVKGSL